MDYTDLEEWERKRETEWGKKDPFLPNFLLIRMERAIGR